MWKMMPEGIGRHMKLKTKAQNRINILKNKRIFKTH
jgi:hypothetical protein